jgi:hypothetical protein
MTASSAAASATVRVIGPGVSWLSAIGSTPVRLTRPSVGFSPTRLCDWDGLVIEPSVSVPTVSGARPSAAAVPEPLLDPLGVIDVSYGLSTCPPSDE